MPEPDEDEDEGEHLDDDLDDEEEDTEEHHDVVPDGGSVRVPITMMDSVQRAIYDSTNHRPGWRVPERVRQQDQIVSDAYGEYVAWLRGAHRAPSMTADAKPVRRFRSLADARVEAQRAYQDYVRYLTDTHKQGRQP